MVFNATWKQYFNFMAAISFIGGTRRKLYRPSTSHWKHLSLTCKAVCSNLV